MKRGFLFLAATFLLFPLAADPAFFAGLHGSVSLPSTHGTDAVWGTGGGAAFELGGYFGRFSAGVLGSLTTVSDEGDLVEKITEIRAGAEAGYTFDKDILRFLPRWLGIRPNGALLIDWYNAEGYRSESKKTLGKKETSSGLSAAGELTLAFDLIHLFETQSFRFIPTLGYTELVRVEQEKGLVRSGSVSLGLRVLYTPPPRLTYEDFQTGEGGVIAVRAPIRQKLFTPDGDGEDDVVIFDVTSDAEQYGGAAQWELRIYDPGTNLFFRDSGKGEPPAVYEWDGFSGDGAELVEGGSLYQYVWYVKSKDGSDGYIPGIISTGIIVEEHDGVLSFSLSSIQFGPNSAEFEALTPEQARRNDEIFDLAAGILAKFSTENIIIEGHAHNVTGTEREHREELLPLSQARAETVKRELEKRGIDGSRMRAVGRGSEVMLTHKKEEAWKNRRVEFILKHPDAEDAPLSPDGLPEEPAAESAGEEE